MLSSNELGSIHLLAGECDLSEKVERKAPTRSKSSDDLSPLETSKLSRNAPSRYKSSDQFPSRQAPGRWKSSNDLSPVKPSHPSKRHAPERWNSSDKLASKILPNKPCRRVSITKQDSECDTDVARWNSSGEISSSVMLQPCRRMSIEASEDVAQKIRDFFNDEKISLSITRDDSECAVEVARWSGSNESSSATELSKPHRRTSLQGTDDVAQKIRDLLANEENISLSLTKEDSENVVEVARWSSPEERISTKHLPKPCRKASLLDGSDDVALRIRDLLATSEEMIAQKNCQWAHSA
jgi:hypothetical protein